MYEKETRSQAHYQRRARLYDWANRLSSLVRGISGMKERRKAVERLELRQGARVLEVSVGTGTNLPLITERTGPSGHLVGLDIAPNMLRSCRRKLNDHGFTADLVVGEAAHLPFADNAFDAVLHHGGLAEFGDKPQALAEMLRVTQSGKKVVVCDAGVPADGKLSLPNRLLLNFQPEYRQHPPTDLLPSHARDVRLSWFHGGGWYMIECTKGESP